MIQWSEIQPHLLNRFYAKGIDLLISFILAFFLPQIIGPLLGVIYILFSDALSFGDLKSQSVGKKIFALRAVHFETGKEISIQESAIRNSTLAMGLFFSIIPVWGWVFFLLIGVPLVLIEAFLLVRADGNRRLGDIMAETDVKVFKD